MSWAAKVWTAIGLVGLDIGIATRHWLTDGFDMSNGLLQGQVRGEVWWNTRFVDVAREMSEPTTASGALVAFGIAATLFAAAAGVLVAIACGRGSRRCALYAIVAVVAAAAAAGAFLYLYPLLHMTPSWSAFAFAAGVLATIAAAATVRATRPGSPAGP